MSIETTELEEVYDKFLTKGLAKLLELQKTTQMEDEHLATASSNVIVGAMQNSSSAYGAIKRNELLVKEIVTEEKRSLDIVSTTNARDAQSVQDILNKASQKNLTDKQVFTEEKKTLDVESATSVRNAQSTQDLLNKAGQLSLMGKQELKVVSDTAFVDEQKVQLGYSVTYNNRIKVLENYSDMIGNVGVGGFVVSADMWGSYFTMVNSIFTNYGDVPVETSITTPANTTLTKP